MNTIQKPEKLFNTIQGINEILISMEREPVFTGTYSDYKTVKSLLLQTDKPHAIKMLQSFELGRESLVSQMKFPSYFRGDQAEHPLFSMKKMNDQAVRVQQSVEITDAYIEALKDLSRSFYDVIGHAREEEGESWSEKMQRISNLARSAEFIVNDLCGEHEKTRKAIEILSKNVQEMYRRK